MLATSRGCLGCEISAARTLSEGPGSLREPLEVIISVRLLTRSRCALAMRCAIMPPIGAPQTWPAGEPGRADRPDAVARHVGQRVRAADAQAERVADGVDGEVGG